MTYWHLLVPAATIFLTTLLILSAGSQVPDTAMDEEARRTSHGVERLTFRRKRRQTGYKDRQRDCKDGHFKDYTMAAHSEDFDCKKCTNCTALKKQTQQACERQHNARCGPCLFGFCKWQDTCQPCPTVGYKSTMWMAVTTTDPLQPSRTKSPSLSHRGIPREVQCNTVCQTALGACSCLVFFGGALILYYKKKKKFFPAGEKSLAFPKFDTNIPSFGNPATSFPEAAILLEKDHYSLLQGKKLYTIINAVPVRHWKEFVRGLGLRDDEIELVELDYSQFREQQYEMLKRWCQRQGASLDAVFTTLEEMELGGCAQELRAQLQLQHSP